jgi:hypothetical protein
LYDLCSYDFQGGNDPSFDNGHERGGSDQPPKYGAHMVEDLCRRAPFFDHVACVHSVAGVDATPLLIQIPWVVFTRRGNGNPSDLGHGLQIISSVIDVGSPAIPCDLWPAVLENHGLRGADFFPHEYALISARTKMSRIGKLTRLHNNQIRRDPDSIGIAALAAARCVSRQRRSL